MNIRRNNHTYPALYSGGFISVSLDDIQNVFLPIGANSSRRKMLANQLRLFIQKLQSTGVSGDLWVDGSFSTKNLEPMDIDLLLVISRVVFSALTEKGQKELYELTDYSNREYVRAKWSCDFYVIESSDIASRRYYEDLFSRNPDSSNRKGIPVISI
jgi:hypothetical protein